MTQEARALVPRDLFAPAHDQLRRRFRTWAERVLAPRIPEWDRRGTSDRESWHLLGAEGFLGLTAPAAHGGQGLDFLHNVVVMEELARLRAHALMFWLHAEVGLSYLLSYGSEAQRARWVPGAVRGDVLLGVALTEPEAGSDLAALTTAAERDGDGYRLDGEKAFISHSQIADLFLVAARTSRDAPPGVGISLFLVDATTPGLSRLPRLDKIGLRGQDTGGLRFDGCRLGADALLGRRDRGFELVLDRMERERLCLAITSMASCRRTLADTIAHVRERRLFGAPLAALQNTQFVLAGLATEIEVGQAFVDRVAARAAEGRPVGHGGSMAKLWASALQRRVAAECLQLHGGRGLLAGSAIAIDHGDAAVQTIHGGSSEVLKSIVARDLGLS